MCLQFLFILIAPNGHWIICKCFWSSLEKSPRNWICIHGTKRTNTKSLVTLGLAQTFFLSQMLYNWLMHCVQEFSKWRFKNLQEIVIGTLGVKDTNINILVTLKLAQIFLHISQLFCKWCCQCFIRLWKLHWKMTKFLKLVYSVPRIQISRFWSFLFALKSYHISHVLANDR